MAKKKVRPQMSIHYMEKTDSFGLFIRGDEDEEWSYMCSCQCVRCADDAPGAEPAYVSYALLKEIQNAVNMGYEIVRY